MLLWLLSLLFDRAVTTENTLRLPQSLEGNELQLIAIVTPVL